MESIQNPGAVFSVVTLFTLAAIAMLGVLHPVYDDTLCQRVSLSFISVFSIAQGVATLDCKPIDYLTADILAAVTAYAAATLLKRWRQLRARSRCSQPFSRS